MHGRLGLAGNSDGNEGAWQNFRKMGTRPLTQAHRGFTASCNLATGSG